MYSIKRTSNKVKSGIVGLGKGVIGTAAKTVPTAKRGVRGFFGMFGLKTRKSRRSRKR